jgi:uncharacterized membrane protein HdeD (DUF308 family)
MEGQKLETRRPGRLSRAESEAWGGSFALGALWTIAGVLCFAAIGAASAAAVYWVGALLAIGGVLSIIWAFRGAGGGAAILGILSLVVGVLLFIYPGAGLVSLTMLLIGYFFIAGLYRVFTSLIDRYPGWGFECISGLCAIAIGVIAVRSWPVSSFWLLGTLIGAELVVRGIFMMAGAVSARRVMRDIRTPT